LDLRNRLEIVRNLPYKKIVGNKGETRARLIKALKDGRVQHEMPSGKIIEEDLFQSGQVSAKEVIEFLRPSRGLRYEEVPHSSIAGLKSKIFRSNLGQGGLPVSWYVKCYCLSDDPSGSQEEVWFVSVYASSERKQHD